MHFDTKAIQSQFGRAAQAYDEYAMVQKHVREACVTLAKPHLSGGARVLDLGAGTGALAKAASTWTITGLDISYGMCSLATQHQRIVNANAEAIPFADASFDGVVSSLMLQWVNHPHQVMREMARVVAPSGKMVISTMVTGTLLELKSAFAAVDAHEHVSHFWDTHHLLQLAKEAGCSLVLAKESAVVEYYPDAIALMRALQAIGATHKQSGRRRGLMTPKQFARMEQHYEQLRTDKGLPATWQVLHLVLTKA